MTKRIRKPPKTSVPQRANNSPTRWKKGESGNPGGRAVLPDWFKDAAPSALAMLVAAGTGRVVELDDDSKEELLARKEMARDAPANIREAASNKMVERHYGKIKDIVEVDAPEDSPLLRALVALARPPKQPDET